MARPRQPIDLLIAKGRKHLTKDEIEERKAQELEVPFTDIEPPSYLTGAKRIKEFNHISGMLVKLGIFTELDVDILAQYIMAKELYITYSKQLEDAMKKADSVNDKWSLVNKLACSAETTEDLIALLEIIVKKQRGDEATMLMNLQDKAFKQCLACAKELGLTITGRCKLVIPPPPEEDEEL